MILTPGESAEVNAMPKPSEKEMESEMETVERASGLPGTLPFKHYLEDTKRLRQHIERLEKEYDEREKVIERIMEYGTGVETEKALRVYSTRVLEKWEAALEKSKRK